MVGRRGLSTTSAISTAALPPISPCCSTPIGKPRPAVEHVDVFRAGGHRWAQTRQTKRRRTERRTMVPSSAGIPTAWHALHRLGILIPGRSSANPPPSSVILQRDLCSPPRCRRCESDTQINVPVSATRSRGLTPDECEWQITWMSENPLEENDDRPCTLGARFQRGQGIDARGSSRREVRCTYHGRN